MHCWPDCHTGDRCNEVFFVCQFYTKQNWFKKSKTSNTCTVVRKPSHHDLIFMSLGKDANRLVSFTSRSLWRFGFLCRCTSSFTTCWKTGQNRGDRTTNGDRWSSLCFEWWHWSTRTLCITKIDRGRCWCALVLKYSQYSGFCPYLERWWTRCGCFQK